MILGAYQIGAVPIGYGAFPPPAALKALWPYVRIAPRWLYALIAPPRRYVAVLPPTLNYTLVASPFTGGSVPPIKDLPDVGINQQPVISLDFGGFLPPGVTLAGTPVVQLTSTDDPYAQTRISAGPVVGVVPVVIGGTGIANSAILFGVSGCVAGAFYVVEGYCARSDGNGNVELSTRFQCVVPS